MSSWLTNCAESVNKSAKRVGNLISERTKRAVNVKLLNLSTRKNEKWRVIATAERTSRRQALTAALRQNYFPEYEKLQFVPDSQKRSISSLASIPERNER